MNGCTCDCDQCLALNCAKNPSAPIQNQVRVRARLEVNGLAKEPKLEFDEKSDKNDETKQESVEGGGTSSNR